MPPNHRLVKSMLVNSLFLSGCILCGNSNAALLNNSILSFSAGTTSCLLNNNTYPDCSYGTTVSSGSYIGFDTNANGVVSSAELAALDQVQGITLGTLQGIGQIDNQWEHITGFGQHFQSSAITILSDDGAGNVTLDFSGWNMQWTFKDTLFGTENYDLGGGNLAFPSETGVATVSCGLDCSTGDSFVLDYAVHTLSYTDEGNALPSTLYQLHLEGTINAVPVPAAFWLFTSGLLAVAGLSGKTRKSA